MYHYDSAGRELPTSTAASTQKGIEGPEVEEVGDEDAEQRGIDGPQVEEVGDEEAEADRKYREGIEEEYAKREGGA